jgi:uncharacterized membrane protein HdeD (DUF308 family)
MGTANDWIGVLGAGALWGGIMLFIAVRNRRKDNLQPHVFPALVLVWGFAGLAFGMVIRFHFSQAFGWPLILITLGAIGAFVAAAIYIRVKRLAVSRTQPPV